ncbi:hypothetical protein ACUOF2_25110, partial [Escherichia coli]
GKVSGIASVMRDETREFQKNREMRKRLAELEALASARTAGPDQTVSEAELEAPQGCPIHKG